MFDKRKNACLSHMEINQTFFINIYPREFIFNKIYSNYVTTMKKINKNC